MTIACSRFPLHFQSFAFGFVVERRKKSKPLHIFVLQNRLFETPTDTKMKSCKMPPGKAIIKARSGTTTKKVPKKTVRN
jgi:hypothetical protein